MQRGGESSSYEAGFGNYMDVVESEYGYDSSDDIPSIYNEIVDHDNGHELQQPEERILYEIDVKVSDYECPDASQQPISTIYDELEFDI